MRAERRRERRRGTVVRRSCSTNYVLASGIVRGICCGPLESVCRVVYSETRSLPAV